MLARLSVIRDASLPRLQSTLVLARAHRVIFLFLQIRSSLHIVNFFLRFFYPESFELKLCITCSWPAILVPTACM